MGIGCCCIGRLAWGVAFDNGESGARVGAKSKDQTQYLITSTSCMFHSVSARSMTAVAGIVLAA